MNGITLTDLASACGGHLEGPDLEITRVCTDSRSVQAGDIFLCLRGDNFDGHDYALRAVDAGAVAVVVETVVDTRVAQLVVPDTQKALGLAAMLWRQSLPVKLVGVTGSNGKTTVKQLLTSICVADGQAHATRANDNNQIGVPQTLFGITAEHKYAVVEMGANQPGEIEWLSHISQPTVALITNASASHLEGFGSVETVAREKGAIYQSLIDGGIAVINADDDFAPYWRQENAARTVITFGAGANADVYAERLSATRIVLNYCGEAVQCEFLLPGQHNVLNAAAAAAAAIAVGVPLERIAVGLSQATAVAGRLNFHYPDSGHVIIDDTYNANPASTRAAIDVLQQTDGQKILLLGDLRELGADAQQQHTSIGRYAKMHGVDCLLTFGPLSRHASIEFGQAENCFNNKADMLQCAIEAMSTKSVVLVKGSRSMQMEELVAGLLAWDTDERRTTGKNHP